MALLGSIIFSCFGIHIFLILLGIAYGMFDLVNTVSCCIVRKFYPQFILLPLIFPLLHITYGIGTVVGLIKLPFWKKSLNDSSKKQIEEVKEKIISNTKR